MTSYRTVREFDEYDTPKLVKGDTVHMISTVKARGAARTSWVGFTHCTPTNNNGHEQDHGWLGTTGDPSGDSFAEYATGRAIVVSLGAIREDVNGNAWRPVKVRPNADAPDTFAKVDDEDGYEQIVRVAARNAGEVVA